MDVVRAVVPVHSLRAFQAAADGTEGAAIGVPVSHNGDFDVVANLPANSKWGFELAAGRVLVGVFNANGRNEMNRFTQAGQVWDADQRDSAAVGLPAHRAHGARTVTRRPTMKRTLPLSALASLLVLVAGAAELTNDYPVTTYDTVVPGDTNQPVAFGEHVAVSETDATDLETHVNDRAPDCTNGQIRQRGSVDVELHRHALGRRHACGQQHHGGAGAGQHRGTAQGMVQPTPDRRRLERHPQRHRHSDREGGRARRRLLRRDHQPQQERHWPGRRSDQLDTAVELLRCVERGWYPAGLVRRACQPAYVATSAVVNTDPAPNAARTPSGCNLAPCQRSGRHRLVEHVDSGQRTGQHLRPHRLVEHHLHAAAGVWRKRRPERMGSGGHQSRGWRPDD